MMSHVRLAIRRSTPVIQSLKPRCTRRHIALAQTAVARPELPPPLGHQIQPPFSSPRKRRSQPISFDGEHLCLSGDSRSTKRIPNSWLRDHCKCPECFNSITQQRETSIFQRPTPRIQSCNFNGTVNVTWADGHQSVYPASFLLTSKSPKVGQVRTCVVEQKRWDRSIEQNPPTLTLQSIQSHGLADLTRTILTHGICFVTGLAPTATATQSLISSIGPLRNTHFGSIHKVTSDLNSKDTAYTDAALDLHTDTTYFSDPAGLLALHLLSHPNGQGGESVFVDAAHAAQIMRDTAPEKYETLRTARLFFHASGNDAVSVTPSWSMPTFMHDPEDPFAETGLRQIRWNNADRAGFAGDLAEIEKWYDAARMFDSLINDRKNQFHIQLKPGTCAIVDNWRLLHGRKRIIRGQRELCTAYVSRDDFLSRYRTTNFSAQEVIDAVVSG